MVSSPFRLAHVLTYPKTQRTCPCESSCPSLVPLPLECARVGACACAPHRCAVVRALPRRLVIALGSLPLNLLQLASSAFTFSHVRLCVLAGGRGPSLATRLRSPTLLSVLVEMLNTYRFKLTPPLTVIFSRMCPVAHPRACTRTPLLLSGVSCAVMGTYVMTICFFFVCVYPSPGRSWSSLWRRRPGASAQKWR